MIFKVKTKTSVIDPVCGMDVNPQTVTFVSTYKNTAYHFCAESCRTAFDNNPEKYLTENNEQPKGFWKRYLERLNKATGGKPPQCCQ